MGTWAETLRPIESLSYYYVLLYRYSVQITDYSILCISEETTT